MLTILSRPHDKDMLVRRPAGRGYAPARDEASQTAVQMHTLPARGSDREAALSRFVSELCQKDEQLLHRRLGGQDARHGDVGP
ncbi:hypothetical protein [Streptomyces fagopyri]|uniref:hypothetical protein n=1 Tax=Streptomyces fagopyri TaxID=2662397 RepID=UPI0033C38D85